MLREALVAALFLVPLLPVSAGDGDPPPCANGENVLPIRFAMPGGEIATGCRGVPRGDVRAILVFAHGYEQSAAAWTSHMQRYAERGVASITMDYRGAWNEFPLEAGAEDTVRAAQVLNRFYTRAGPTVLFGVSMGGAVSGMALAQAPAGTFDAWFMVEGLSTLAETWAEATAAQPVTAAQIEAECGGTPAEVPEAYIARSPAFHAAEMQARGVDGVVLVHAVNDGRVPVDQGLQMSAALLAANVATETYLVLRGDPDEPGTTGTGVLGLGDTDEVHHLAGHAWEGSATHIVMATAFARLDRYLAGESIGTDAHLVDHELGTMP